VGHAGAEPQPGERPLRGPCGGRKAPHLPITEAAEPPNAGATMIYSSPLNPIYTPGHPLVRSLEGGGKKKNWRQFLFRGWSQRKRPRVFRLAVSHLDAGYLGGKLNLQRGLEAMLRHQSNYFRLHRLKFIDNPSFSVMMDF